MEFITLPFPVYERLASIVNKYATKKEREDILNLYEEIEEKERNNAQKESN